MISFQEMIRPVIRFIRNNMILVVLGAVFLGIVLFAFGGSVDNNENFQNGDGIKNDAVFRFFYVDWCPHCQDAKPEWEKFARKCPKTIGRLNLRCESINAEQNSEMAKVYSVQSYPTFILETDGMKTEYSGDRNAEAFLEWIREQSEK